MSFDRALPVILRAEGGYADVEGDRGGATNRGITTGTYDLYRSGKGLPHRPVREITDAEVREIYESGYWREACCDRLPWPASLVVFDAAVNHGAHRARKLLQQALGVATDGIVGPVTLTAVGRADPAELAREILWLRLDFYVDIAKAPSQLKFLRGWVRRMVHLREEVDR